MTGFGRSSGWIQRSSAWARDAATAWYPRPVRALRPGLTPVLAAALLVAACGSSGPESQATDIPSDATPSAAATPAASSGGSPTTGPAATASRPPAASPSAAPSVRPSAAATAAASIAPGGSAPPGDLAACSGNDSNRTFFSGAAAAYSWDVYCAALPKGWFVDSGSRKSGLLTIGYKTTGGLRFELKEGAVCSGTPASCGPLDSTIGTAMFGDRQGQLGRYAGNFVLYVNPGANPSWQATGIGLDEATFRSFCAALVKVPG